MHQYIQHRAQDYLALVQRIQRCIITILREDQEYRQSHRDIANSSLTITTHIDIHQALNWPLDPAKTLTITFRKAAIALLRPPKHIAQASRIARFLRGLTIQPREATDSGITCLELLIAYEHQCGTYNPPPKTLAQANPAPTEPSNVHMTSSAPSNSPHVTSYDMLPPQTCNNASSTTSSSENVSLP